MLTRRPSVAGKGVPFSGVPGAVLYTASEPVCDISWPVCTGEAPIVVVEFPDCVDRPYLVIDPLCTEGGVTLDASSGQTGISIYRRRKHDVNLVRRGNVAAFFAEVIKKKRRARPRNPQQTDGNNLRFKRIADADYAFALPYALSQRGGVDRPSADFSDPSAALRAVANLEHTLVLPCDANAELLYAYFFKDTPQLERAAYNWCGDHPFAEAIAKTCTAGGGPVQFARGKFVCDAAFFACIAQHFAQILVEYLVISRRKLWSRLAKFEDANNDQNQLSFDTDNNIYVDVASGKGVQHPASLKRKYVWIEPDELIGNDADTRKTRSVLVRAFSSDPAPSPMHVCLDKVPVLPACIAHTMHLETFPGMPAAKSDYLSRSRLAYLMNALRNATGLDPLEMVDHRAYFRSLRPDQKKHYLYSLKQGNNNKMAGPLCRNTERNPNAKGMVCIKCPRACGRANSIPINKLVHPQARPLWTMGIYPETDDMPRRG